MEETQIDRSGQKSDGELVLPGSSLVFASRGLYYWPLVRMKQHVTKAIGCWAEVECLRPSIEAGESAIQPCDIIPIGSFRKDHASVPPKRGTERRNSLKVPFTSPILPRIIRSQIGLHPPHHKNTLQSTSAQC